MADKTDILDRDFLAARASLLDVAAFLDRLDRGEGEGDFRAAGLRRVLPILLNDSPDRVRMILEALSCSGDSPMDAVHGFSACGAPLPSVSNSNLC